VTPLAGFAFNVEWGVEDRRDGFASRDSCRSGTMQPFVIWFVAAFVLVAAELMSGTLYLLVIGAGAAAAGALALAGAGFAAQLACAAVVSVVGSFVLKQLRRSRNGGAAGAGLSFDAGQAVEVVEQLAGGGLRVNYRGTQWDAEVEGGGSANVGDRLIIKSTRGNTLVLAAHN
jgi:membrane protein implicated in regulation of membrane protease activity